MCVSVLVCGCTCVVVQFTFTVCCLQGKVVTIQIEDMQMKWLSPESTTPLCVQAIGKIRVWGIGLENER